MKTTRTMQRKNEDINAAETFIKTYLEVDKQVGCRIKGTDLFKEFIDYRLTSVSIQKFYQLLRDAGYPVTRRSNNVTFVYYIKSNWL